MTKVTMPEPVMFDATGLDGAIYSHGYSASQMEAYAAAKVREALEEAAQTCEARIGTGNPGIDTSDCDAEAIECAAAIRALIPQHDNE